MLDIGLKFYTDLVVKDTDLELFIFNEMFISHPQGWQKPGFYEYCPAQRIILGNPGFTSYTWQYGLYWVISI